MDLDSYKHKNQNKWVKIMGTFQLKIRKVSWDFPGGAVVKKPPANAGDTGSSPGPGRSHMLWSN